MRYFPAATVDVDAWGVLMRGRLLHLAVKIVREPGVQQRTIIGELGITRKTFRDYANLLIRQGLVSEVRHWRDRHYYPSPRLVNALSEKSDEATTGSSTESDGEAIGAN